MTTDPRAPSVHKVVEPEEIQVCLLLIDELRPKAVFGMQGGGAGGDPGGLRKAAKASCC